jgi:hypothetical protein
MASWKHLVAGSRGVPAVRFRRSHRRSARSRLRNSGSLAKAISSTISGRGFFRGRGPGPRVILGCRLLIRLGYSPRRLFTRYINWLQAIIVANALLITVATPYVLHMITVKRRNVMIPDELTVAARNLAHSLGIPVYIRDGRIYQHGPGIEFLPPKDPAASIAEDLSTIVDEDGF